MLTPSKFSMLSLSVTEALGRSFCKVGCIEKLGVLEVVKTNEPSLSEWLQRVAGP